MLNASSVAAIRQVPKQIHIEPEAERLVNGHAFHAAVSVWSSAKAVALIAWLFARGILGACGNARRP